MTAVTMQTTRGRRSKAAAAGAVREEMIRERAYHLWEAEGRPDGRQDAHWRRAEQEFDGAAASRANGSAAGTKAAINGRSAKAKSDPSAPANGGASGAAKVARAAKTTAPKAAGNGRAGATGAKGSAASGRGARAPKARQTTS